MEAPLTLFVWSKSRVVPVRVTDFSDHRGGVRSRRSTRSAPRSASACACSSVDDLGFAHKGGSLFMAYLQSKEQLAGTAQPRQLRRARHRRHRHDATRCKPSCRPTR